MLPVFCGISPRVTDFCTIFLNLYPLLDSIEKGIQVTENFIYS